MDLIRNEPVLTGQIATIIVTIALALGVHLTVEQVTSIISVLLLGVGFLVREFVRPTAKEAKVATTLEDAIGKLATLVESLVPPAVPVSVPDWVNNAPAPAAVEPAVPTVEPPVVEPAPVTTTDATPADATAAVPTVEPPSVVQPAAAPDFVDVAPVQ